MCRYVCTQALGGGGLWKSCHVIVDSRDGLKWTLGRAGNQAQQRSTVGLLTGVEASLGLLVKTARLYACSAVLR